jgi:flavin reductase (DIM6/NTAB) family NADH-FMN oxidoreductase RutF
MAGGQPVPKTQITPNRPIYPTPAALITSVDAAGRPNIITLGEVFNISIRQPVILGIATRKATYSHALISQTCEYVVNLPTRSILDQVQFCGSVSGRTVDKFERSGLTPLPASVVRPPLIAECPINIECKVIGIQVVGDHDLFLGQAVAQHVDEALLDRDGRIMIDKLDGFAYVLGEFWTLGAKIE